MAVNPSLNLRRRTSKINHLRHNWDVTKDEIQRANEEWARVLRQALREHVAAAMQVDSRINTQQKLADRAGVGQGTVSRILNAKTGVTLDNLAAVARACGVMAYRLLTPEIDAPNPLVGDTTRAQSDGVKLPK